MIVCLRQAVLMPAKFFMALDVSGQKPVAKATRKADEPRQAKRVVKIRAARGQSGRTF